MESLLKSLPSTFIPLFVAIDLFWLLPIFMGITQGLDETGRKKVVRQSVATAFIVSLVFTAVGEATFNILGIMVDDFKVAGGLVLLVIAILDLTRIERKRRAVTVSENSGIVPIGVPLIVGPAVMTTIIVLVDHYGILPTVIGLVLNLTLVWVCFLGANRIVKFLGTSAITALSKIMSILLASIAVMMIRLGLEGILAR
jgi:multiple antibiotic resistance protein